MIHKYRNNKNLANSKILGKIFTNQPKSSNKQKKKKYLQIYNKGLKFNISENIGLYKYNVRNKNVFYTKTFLLS